MCGIFCSITSKRACPGESFDCPVDDRLKRRGPDHQECRRAETEHYSLLFQATVLHMRGAVMEKQPAVSGSGDVFLWNGEVFGGLLIPKHESDTTALLASLEQHPHPLQILDILTSIQGPWAFVYFAKASNTIWFGRDYFGRRSLLLSVNTQTILLSSTRNDCSCSWIELSANGLYCLDLNNPCNNLPEVYCYPWVRFTGNPIVDPKVEALAIKSVTTIKNSISLSMHKDTDDIPKLEDEVLHCNDPIMMLENYCNKAKLWGICDQFLAKLKSSIERRLQVCEHNEAKHLGVLFSGGIDCTVLAALSHLCLSPDQTIDLVNVAFEQRKSPSNKKCGNTKHAKYEVPDRVTGLASWSELKRLFPERRWNFVTVNVTVDELASIRKSHICYLTYPKVTVLDDSIACAIWFAARAKGEITEGSKVINYTSDCRVVLCGMGADEQLGGYSRHRGMYDNTKDWQFVAKEMNMDIERISERNLGRDDRVISDHGREARFPFLDEKVVEFLSNLPVHIKSDYRLPRGVGEKIVLRGAAYRLGLRAACVLPKRAIQFGSRIAKAESRKEKGNDPCIRLKPGVTV